MEIEKLKQSYQQKLIQAGIESHRIEQAVKNITIEELHFISDIWSQWTSVAAEKELMVNTEAF